jgi:hypothetical protein
MGQLGKVHRLGGPEPVVPDMCIMSLVLQAGLENTPRRMHVKNYRTKVINYTNTENTHLPQNLHSQSKTLNPEVLL